MFAELHSIKRKVRFRQSIEVGDVVVLKMIAQGVHFKKLQCSSCEVIIEGSDRVMRAAVVKVARQDGQPRILKCSAKHLYPLEIKSNCKNIQPMLITSQDSEGSKEDERVKDNDNFSRPRRTAALTGGLL